MSEYVQWCARAWGREPTPAEALLIDVVCDGLGTGPWNVPALAEGRVAGTGGGASIHLYGYLATWDAPSLSGLVFAAHDRCARVNIGATMNYIRISVYARLREPGDLSITRGHPTLEQAVAAWREHHPLPTTEGAP